MEKRVLENHNGNRFIHYEFGTPGDETTAADGAGASGATDGVN